MNKKKIIEELDLGRFSDSIDKDNLHLNEDGTFDYDGELNLANMEMDSLKEIPIRLRRVLGFFGCHGNNLISLEGCPESVVDFDCSLNELISLQYAPTRVNGSFNCESNNLLSIKCLSDFYRDSFKSKYNPFYENSNVINTVKRMTYQQQIKELDFLTYRKNSTKSKLKAFDVMKKVLDDLGVHYGERTREMVAHKNSLDIGHLL